MLHIPALWYFDISVTYPQGLIESNLLQYPYVLYSSNICDILLYNRQLVVLTYKANMRCSGCSPLGLKILWNRTLQWSTRGQSLSATETSWKNKGKWIMNIVNQGTKKTTKHSTTRLCNTWYCVEILWHCLLDTIYARRHITITFCILWTQEATLLDTWWECISPLTETHVWKKKRVLGVEMDPKRRDHLKVVST